MRERAGYAVAQVAEQLRRNGARGPDVHLLVALSGGRDSVTLLHLLSFALLDPPRLSAAHFDHRMRPGSGADADWVTGLCRAWRIPLVCGQAERAPGGEAEARVERYAFLRHVQRTLGCTHLATAHHADDQAETVLFRALRGAGVEGLRGIAAAGAGGLIRPLLDVPGQEVAAYAHNAALRWREDPTNRQPVATRNRLRRLLPHLEQIVPGAGRSLVRLAATAAEEARAWEAALVPWLVEAGCLQEGALLLDRNWFRAAEPALAARVLRRLLQQVEITLDGAGTGRLIQFIISAASGRAVALPGGAVASVEYGSVRVSASPLTPTAADQTLVLTGPTPLTAAAGAGDLWLGGRGYLVRWAAGTAAELQFQPEEPGSGGGEDREQWSATFDLAALYFPLLLRGWRPGDRLRGLAGGRKVKRWFGDARVPRGERSRRPVLQDRGGRVIWVAGFPPDPAVRSSPGTQGFLLVVAERS